MGKPTTMLAPRRKTGQLYKVEMRTHGTIAYRIPLYQKMIVGSSAGVAGSLVVFPIDMVKARLQNAKPGAATFGGVCRALWREGGARAFYRGLGANVVGVIPEKALKLGVNDWLRDQFSPDRTQEGLLDQTAAGALTGVIQPVARPSSRSSLLPPSACACVAAAAAALPGGCSLRRADGGDAGRSLRTRWKSSNCECR